MGWIYMVAVDMALEELKVYKPELTKQEDFDAFWEGSLKESKKYPLNSERVLYSYPIEEIKVFDIFYDGFKGGRINGWLILPEGADKNRKMPALVYYHGYTRNKGFVQDYLKWLVQGFAVLAVDVRGQGGATGDPALYGQGGVPGWMTRGILDKNRYYYRNVYLDCIRAIDFLSEQEEIDTDRIGIYGVSQGGGLSVAVAALDGRPKFTMPVYPYLCNFERAVEFSQEGPYGEISDYFRQFDPEMRTGREVFNTLSYFDGMNLAPRIKCPVFMGITLMDRICPPSTMFAAYNHMGGEKELRIYHYHGHEALPFHEEAMIQFVRKHFR